MGWADEMSRRGALPDGQVPSLLPWEKGGETALPKCVHSHVARSSLFYGVETLARKVAAFRITESGITIVWKKTQTTTEWATLIGPKEHRVWVGTDIPVDEIPGNNTTERVVWRDAGTGRRLARSESVPQMTQGSPATAAACTSPAQRECLSS